MLSNTVIYSKYFNVLVKKKKKKKKTIRLLDLTDKHMQITKSLKKYAKNFSKTKQGLQAEPRNELQRIFTIRGMLGNISKQL